MDVDYNFDEENWDEEAWDDFDDDDYDPSMDPDDFNVCSSQGSSSQNSSSASSRPAQSRNAAGTSSGDGTTRRGPESSRKTEIKNIALSSESIAKIKDTLRAIHGENFDLKNAVEPPKTSKRELSRSYWMDQGQLVVRNCYNYAQKSAVSRESVNRFALENLELYGFYSNHCCEALTLGGNEFEKALELLISFYFGATFKRLNEPVTYMTEREDEMVALTSIYDDKICEERVKNKHWVFHLEIPSLGQWHFKNNYNRSSSSSHERKRYVCRTFAAKGTCRYGSNCKFIHDSSDTVSKNAQQEADLKLKSSFNLEIRFPENCNYPADMPLIMFSAQHKQFESHVCLRITRYLYNHADTLSQQGSPYCYNLIDMLTNSTDKLIKWLDNESISRLNVGSESSLLGSKYTSAVPQQGCSNLPDAPWEKRLCLDQDSLEKFNQSRDEDLVRMMHDKRRNDKYIRMQKYRKTLPAWNVGDRILDTLKHYPVVVIVGETGCGKSTQVPQFILDDWIYSLPDIWSKDQQHKRINIVCTQPRRLSAIGVADRVAEERIEKAGESVGYQIRLESRSSAMTRLLFCTTGILLKKLESDPELEDVTHIIVDEVHERDEDSDFLLLILKELMVKRRELKIILMSATLNAELFSKYFYNAPLIEIPGKMYPVEELYLEDILDKCSYTLDEYSKYTRKINKSMSKQLDSIDYDIQSADILNTYTASRPSAPDETLSAKQLFFRYKEHTHKAKKTLLLLDPAKIDPELVIDVIQWIVEGKHQYPREGSILVFLPGIADIIAIHDELNNHKSLSPRTGRFIIVPLHSTISNEEQYTVFKRTDPGVRKIVLSTNIAETSITIDDCVFVVDCGKMKENIFDTKKNMSSLEVQWISKANARQRRGRAGRVMPGLCIRLYTSHRHEYLFRAQPVPEIQRAALDSIILRLKTLQQFQNRTPQDVLANVMEPPEVNNVDTAIQRLKDIGALDSDEELTALGRHLAALPVDVKIGKLIVFGAIFCCLDSVLTIAAALSNKSPFVSPFHARDKAEARKKQFATSNSDQLTILKAYQEWHKEASKHYKAGKRYADENFLSVRTLEMMGDLKHQFLELLMDRGFVPNTNIRRRKHEDKVTRIIPRHMNDNSGDQKLLSAIICAALFPNLVKVLTPGKVYVQTAAGAIPKPFKAEDLKFKTKGDGYVNLHPSSINYNEADFKSPYLVYQEKMKTSKIFIHDSTMVSIISIVLFAGEIKLIEDSTGRCVISMENDWLMFPTNTLKEAQMLQCMRKELNHILDEKIRNPQLDLTYDPVGQKVISTIVHVIKNTIS